MNMKNWNWTAISVVIAILFATWQISSNSSANFAKIEEQNYQIQETLKSIKEEVAKNKTEIIRVSERLEAYRESHEEVHKLYVELKERLQ